MTIVTLLRKRGKKAVYSVRMDDSYMFDVSEDVLVKFGLHTGMQLDDKTVEQITTAEGMHRAQQIAINYLSYRPRSSKEIVDHLRKKSFSSDLARAVASHLQKKNMIDDVAFAQSFVRDRLQRKPVGSAMLRQQLMTKGIAPHVIERVLKSLVKEDEQVRAAELIATKRLARSSSLSRLDPAKRKRRILDYLLRRGFSADIATKTVRNVFAHQSEGRAA